MFVLNSRVHPLRHFNTESCTCFVKRDDELSCGISGTKYRKYSSLMPALVTLNIQHLIIIAGPHSNNLLAAVQMAREYGLSLTAVLLKPFSKPNQGNFLLTKQFLHDDDIVWVNRDEWDNVEERAKEIQKSIPNSFVMPEGASTLEAFPGAMTLGDDIIRNEQALGFKFEHIFIDAGTGFSACGLYRSLKKHQHNAMIHCVLMAGDKKSFIAQAQSLCGDDLSQMKLYTPQTARAFGAVNRTIKDEMQRMAMEEGILTEPIYTAKLFHEARSIISTRPLSGKVLIIHSGGLLALTGFEY